jgi:hypothetical protein
VLNDFVEKSEGLFGIITTQVVNLVSDLFEQSWKHLLHESLGTVFVQTSHLGLIAVSIYLKFRSAISSPLIGT